MKGLIDVHICYRDRPTELALLLQSLWRQTYKNFRILISDDASGTPVQTYHFLMCMINKLNESGNFINYTRNEFGYGVSKNRQKLVDMSLKDNICEYICRVDDDVILEPDFIEKLVNGMKDYDLMSGVTPFIGQAQFKRESKFVNPIINRVILDNQGNFVFNGDDCGIEYLDEAVIPTHHFRSSAMYNMEIAKKVRYDDTRLTKHGFREEEIFSFKCILNGFKLGVNTKAIAWHLLTPSGGERFPDQVDLVAINEGVLKEFVKETYAEHGDFISEYNKKLGINPPEFKDELIKSTNLIR